MKCICPHTLEPHPLAKGIFDPLCPVPTHRETAGQELSPEVQFTLIDNPPVSEYHRQTAAMFRKFFRPVPLDDAELLPDPDYGL